MREHMIAWLMRRARVASKQREAERLEHEIWEINDWLAQADRTLQLKQDQLRQLRAELNLELTPDELVRRAGCGA